MAFLYIVATPIGNLEDLSFRALRILKEVDLILSEDTRKTKILLDHYNFKTPVLSYHQHSKFQKIDYIANLLKEGKSLALVSDAGTPGISDPGGQLINFLNNQFLNFKNDNIEELKIVPIPGPSAVTALASISGFSMDKFIFMGFPPKKRKRKKFFEEIIKSKYPVIFYESPHRIIKTLDEIKLLARDREIVISRELTKKFETIYRGKIEEILKEIKINKIKGEFTIALEGKRE